MNFEMSQKKIIYITLLVISGFSFLRTLYFSPNVAILTQLMFLDDCINFITGRFSSVEWFVVGTGHALTGYKYFQMLNTLFFSLDSRLENFLHHGSLFFFIIYLVNIIYKENDRFSWKNIFMYSLIFLTLFSFSGIAPHGMETGTFFGCIIIFYIIIQALRSKTGGKNIIFSHYIVTPIIVFLFLGGYILPFVFSFFLVLLVFFLFGKQCSSFKEWVSKNRHSIILFFVFLLSSFLYFLMLFIFKNNDLQDSSSLFLSQILEKKIAVFAPLFFGLSSPFITHEHVELLSENQATVLSGFISSVILIICFHAIYLSITNLKKNYLLLIPLLFIFYGFSVSALISISRPYGHLWILASWYAFHFKFFVIGLIVPYLLIFQTRVSYFIFNKGLMFFSLLVILLLTLCSYAYKLQRHQHEKKWLENKINATLYPDKLNCIEGGNSELLIGCEDSKRYINLLKEYKLGVFKN